jgi:hypothetical protein
MHLKNCIFGFLYPNSKNGNLKKLLHFSDIFLTKGIPPIIFTNHHWLYPEPETGKQIYAMSQRGIGHTQILGFRNTLFLK